METPKEMIETWKKFIKEEQDKNNLNSIKLDIEAELEMFEEVVDLYEGLVESVEDKLEELEDKNENNKQ